MANTRKPEKEKFKITSLTLDEDTKKKAVELGAGNMSKGVRLAVQKLFNDQRKGVITPPF